MRGSQTTSRPRSVSLRISRPAPCFSDDRRLGDEVVGEGVAAFALEALDARLDERIVRRRERQLVDDHALQRLAGHVDAFPEALRADQHRARRVEEALHQLALRALALDQHLDARRRPRRSSTRSCAPTACSERSVVVSTKVRPPSARAQRAASARDRVGMAGVARLRERARHVDARVRRGSRTGCRARSDARVVEAGRLGEPAQPVVVAQRRRGEDPGLRRASPSARAAPRGCRAATRPGAPGAASRSIQRIWPACGRSRELRRRARRGGAARSCRLGRNRARSRSPCRAPPPRPSQASPTARQRGEEVGRAAALGPAQLQAAAHLAERARRGQAQLARGVIAAGRELLPRRQAARLLQAGGRACRARSRSAAPSRASCRGTARRPRRADAPRRRSRPRRSAAARRRRCRAAPCRRRTGGG